MSTIFMLVMTWLTMEANVSCTWLIDVLTRTHPRTEPTQMVPVLLKQGMRLAGIDCGKNDDAITENCLQWTELV